MKKYCNKIVKKQNKEINKNTWNNKKTGEQSLPSQHSHTTLK